MNCKRCGADLRDNEIFCKKCGQRSNIEDFELEYVAKYDLNENKISEQERIKAQKIKNKNMIIIFSIIIFFIIISIIDFCIIQ